MNTKPFGVFLSLNDGYCSRQIKTWVSTWMFLGIMVISHTFWLAILLRDNFVSPGYSNFYWICPLLFYVVQLTLALLVKRHLLLIVVTLFSTTVFVLAYFYLLHVSITVFIWVYLFCAGAIILFVLNNLNYYDHLMQQLSKRSIQQQRVGFDRIIIELNNIALFTHRICLFVLTTAVVAYAARILAYKPEVKEMFMVLIIGIIGAIWVIPFYLLIIRKAITGWQHARNYLIEVED